MKINKLSMLAVALVAATGVVAVSQSPQAVSAASAGDTPNCKFIYEYGLGQGWTKSAGKVSTTVKIEGDANCTKDLTLATWKVYNDGGVAEPVSNQRIFTHTTGSFKPGRYTMTVNVPDCYHQVDLVVGKNPTGPNNRLPYESNRLLNAYLGGNGTCVEKPVEPQKEVPETPAQEPKETPATPVAEVTELPNTGAGSILASTLGLSTSAGLAYNYIRSRKQLR